MCFRQAYLLECDRWIVERRDVINMRQTDNPRNIPSEADMDAMKQTDNNTWKWSKSPCVLIQLICKECWWWREDERQKEARHQLFIKHPPPSLCKTLRQRWDWRDENTVLTQVLFVINKTGGRGGCHVKCLWLTGILSLFQNVGFYLCFSIHAVASESLTV